MTNALRRDGALAALLLFFAAILFIDGGNLAKGSASRMGPGYAPWLIGIALLVIAAIIIGRAAHGWLRRIAATHETLPPFHWRGVISISLSAIAFALLVKPAGLLIGTVALVLLCTAAQAGEHSGWRERLAVAGLLASLAGLLFSVALGLPISILPSLSS
jgi:hypothetical protein